MSDDAPVERASDDLASDGLASDDRAADDRAADDRAADDRAADDRAALAVADHRVRIDDDVASPPTWLRRTLYLIIAGFLVGVCRLYFRLRIDGADNIPKEGPYILAPVHRSNIDFALVVSCAGARLPRLRYLAKDTLWKGPLGRLWTALGAIPVHRGTPDRDALKALIDIVAAGEPLVIFPEGTRQSGPVVQELFDGPAYVQARTGVPIVPVGIGGSEAAMPKGAKLIRPRRVVLTIGEPLGAPLPNERGRVPRRAVRDQTEHLHVRLQECFDRARAAANA